MAGGNPKNRLKPSKELHVRVPKPPANAVGRPSKYNEDAVKKLLDVFKLGGSVEEACSYAGISKVTYYAWVEKRPNLLTEIEQAKLYPSIVARNIIVESMQRNRDVSTAKWYLEKTAFKNTNNHSGDGMNHSGTPQVNIVFPDLVKNRYADVEIQGEIVDDSKQKGNELIVSSSSTEDLPVKE